MIYGENAWGSAPNPAGAAPLRPALKPKPSQEGTAKPHRPSRWSGISHQQIREKKLALMGGHGLEQLQILSAAHLAGFEVITHGRICGVRRGDVAQPAVLPSPSEKGFSAPISVFRSSITQAHRYPCLRFDCRLATTTARLGAKTDSLSPFL